MFRDRWGARMEIMSTEFGDEKTCFSPSAASAGGFPRMVRDIRLTAAYFCTHICMRISVTKMTEKFDVPAPHLSDSCLNKVYGKESTSSNE